MSSFTASMVKEMTLASSDPVRIFYNSGLIVDLWEGEGFDGNSIYNLSMGPLDIVFDELVVASDELLKLVVHAKESKISIGSIRLCDVKTISGYEQNENVSL